MYNQREIVLLPFPYSDLTGAKQRPALIISNTKLNNTEDRICCLVTSNAPKDGILLSHKSFELGALPFQSWVKPHRIFTVNSRIIKKKLCKVTDEFHKTIGNAIDEYIK